MRHAAVVRESRRPGPFPGRAASANPREKTGLDWKSEGDLPATRNPSFILTLAISHSHSHITTPTGYAPRCPHSHRICAEVPTPPPDLCRDACTPHGSAPRSPCPHRTTPPRSAPSGRITCTRYRTPGTALGISVLLEQGIHNLGTRSFAHCPLIIRTQLYRRGIGRTGDGNCVTIIIRPHNSL